MLKSSRHLVLVFLMLIGTGCTRLLQGGEQLPLHRQMAPMLSGPVCRVAVLPFQSDSDYPLADAIFSKIFEVQFQAAGNHLLIQEGDVLKVYQQLHILPGQTPTREQLQVVAARLHAQLLITGIVLEMRENKGEHGGVDPVVAVEVQIRDGAGDTLWTAYHRRQGTEYRKAMHFGIIHTVSGLSQQVASEIITLWHRKGLPSCDVSP